MATLNDPCRLSNPSTSLKVPGNAASAAGTVPIWSNEAALVLMPWQAESAQSAQRIVQLVGDTSFDVVLTWTGGGGAGAKAIFTVQGSARISVDAKTIRAAVFVRSANDCMVQISTQAGIQDTHNSWIVEWSQVVPPLSGDIRVPPFPAGLRASSSLGLGSAARVEFRNGYGTTTAVVPVNNINAAPAPLNNAASVVVVGLAAGEVVTLSFDLSV